MLPTYFKWVENLSIPFQKPPLTFLIMPFFISFLSHSHGGRALNVANSLTPFYDFQACSKHSFHI